jgi:riboflavin kinase/FMN adenylyltransferase
MAIFHLSWDENPPVVCRGGVLAIGNFDGVHRGHQALLVGLRDRANALRSPAVALTFDPHPLQLLRPEQFKPVLTPICDRATLLEYYQADHVVILRTTPELLKQSAQQFFEHVIVEQLAARSLVEGTNFGFGRNREGNIQALVDLAGRADMEPPVIVPPVLVDGVPVSSSRVRGALVAGKVQEAANLLARSYRVWGTVATGRRRGHSLGFPTANLEQVPMLIPGDGVYAVRARWEGNAWPGAANIGPNPTFGEHVRKVEVHVIGFQGELYGQVVTIDFVDRLRDTRPFASKDELVAQLQNDIDQARRLAERGSGLMPTGRINRG